jgi:hypothetical protein
MKRIDNEEEERWVQVALEHLHRPDALDIIELLAAPPLEVLSLCARPMIVAPRGKKLSRRRLLQHRRAPRRLVRRTLA